MGDPGPAEHLEHTGSGLQSEFEWQAWSQTSEFVLVEFELAYAGVEMYTAPPKVTMAAINPAMSRLFMTFSWLRWTTTSSIILKDRSTPCQEFRARTFPRDSIPDSVTR